MIEDIVPEDVIPDAPSGCCPRCLALYDVHNWRYDEGVKASIPVCRGPGVPLDRESQE